MAEEAPQTPAAAAAPAPEAPKVESKPEQPKEDPALNRLLTAERRIEELTGALEAERTKTKQFERDNRKQSILGALYDGFPGLSREEIRGLALVAQEDGKVDLYHSDTEKQIDALKDILATKAKKPASTSAPTPSNANLGGTPGAPAKPANGMRSGARKWGI